MATELQVPEERISRLDIGDFVQNATWRELLVELVDSKRLDPWDIDISEMLDGYVEVIRRMKVLDLRVPANVILAASILLRLKSESLVTLYSQQEEAESDMLLQGAERPIVEVPNLVMKARMQPGRKITLQELLDAVGSAMEAEDTRKRRIEEIQLPISISIADDIDSRTDGVHELLKSKADRLGMATFSALAQGFSTMEDRLLKLFVPLLYLAQNEVVALAQEELFGEIIIRMLDHHGKGTAKA